MPGLLGAVEGGGTWFRCAVGDAEGTIQEQVRFRTDDDPDATLARVAGWLQARSVEAIGFGCFGPLRLAEGRVGRTPKPGWEGADLLGPLRPLGVPLALHTDVTVAALGEQHRGNGQGAGSLLYITVGTGIGGGLLLDGNVPRNKMLHAEFGHILIPRHPEDSSIESVCPFHADCLEGMASGPALLRRWKTAGEGLSADHPAWEREAYYLALGLRSALAVAAPERVVLGGGVGENPALWPPLRRQVREVLSGYWPDLDTEAWLRPTGLGADSTLTGGLILAAGSLPYRG